MKLKTGTTRTSCAQMEKWEYCGAVKWELSLAESKMGETWSDGGPPLLGLALCLLSVTAQLRSQ